MEKDPEIGSEMMGKDTLIGEFLKKNPDFQSDISTPVVEEFKAFIKFHIKIGFWSEEDARVYIANLTDEIFKK